ncbi:MAG: peptidoglycan editing factor PgeF [Thiohalomonadaceae bacterium]
MLLVRPNWPAPEHVMAATTTRIGGVSVGPWAGLNLSDHAGDELRHVSENRRRLRQSLDLPSEPLWLEQVHGTAVLQEQSGCADASVAFSSGKVCAVLTADCLPVLLCDRAGTAVAAIHAGWRGLLAGVIEAAVLRLQRSPDEILAWLGPAIGPNAFEVGEEVRQAFVFEDAAAATSFQPLPTGRWLADLYSLARLRLVRCGVQAVYGGGLCTLQDERQFYSYRRDGVTGRMASLIWLAL